MRCFWADVGLTRLNIIVVLEQLNSDVRTTSSFAPTATDQLTEGIIQAATAAAAANILLLLLLFEVYCLSDALRFLVIRKICAILEHTLILG